MKVYDFIAIGLGPFNLSLAAMTQPLENADALFLEQRSEFNWHPGMMLEGTHLQTPFMSDLVTLADPTSPYSFLNYLKQQGKLYRFYIRENFFILRREYNLYCQWVCRQLSNLKFDTRVIQVEFDNKQQHYCIDTINPVNGETDQFLAKKLVLGTGPIPHIPEGCDALGDHAIHSSDYLNWKSQLLTQPRISVIGGGQSAAEIVYDLLEEQRQGDFHLDWISRSPRYFPLEYSKLTLEMTSPEYVDYFHQLPEQTREHLLAQQQNLYKGINADLINDIFDRLYEMDLHQAPKVTLMTSTSVDKIERQDNGYQLQLRHQEQQSHGSLSTRALIFATGYRGALPGFLSGIADQINWDGQERLAVSRHYAIDDQQRLFVQNAELHTHGFVTPDLGMACYRNSVLLQQLLGWQPYPIERKIAFQQFGLNGVNS
ncbi:lysine N(6)-hydroxylase/L-ornithine N(5)-oxygenase family protein [Ferrimonas aestuarii]|uniref:Alcaligin biosynthesis protein n=1 Tax=Ferrimonas aestuarii TaxID=2569539 RepID=A0A4V5NVE1_9GAMM|nr:SidA/IucD/PvdA family monooxygenase [Ferrimonas aestuarii]TKB50118.1 alcaligin biosynthesis protein [Ferrimonas aestuarii]